MGTYIEVPVIVRGISFLAEGTYTDGEPMQRDCPAVPADFELSSIYVEGNPDSVEHLLLPEVVREIERAAARKVRG